MARQLGVTYCGALQVDSPSFTPYLQKYITYEAGRLRSSLRLLSIDFLHLDQYINKVAGRPQLLKVVRSNKERTEKAMRRDLETLQQLLAKGLDYLPAEVQEDVRAHPDWTVDLLKRGELFEVCVSTLVLCTGKHKSPLCCGVHLVCSYAGQMAAVCVGCSQWASQVTGLATTAASQQYQQSQQSGHQQQYHTLQPHHTTLSQRVSL